MNTKWQDKSELWATSSSQLSPPVLSPESSAQGLSEDGAQTAFSSLFLDTLRCGSLEYKHTWLLLWWHFGCCFNRLLFLVCFTHTNTWLHCLTGISVLTHCCVKAFLKSSSISPAPLPCHSAPHPADLTFYWYPERLLGINHACTAMYWYAGVCSVISPEQHGREISIKLASRLFTVMDSKVMLSNVNLSNMYIKPQGSLNQVNMTEVVLCFFISPYELSLWNLNAYSWQGWCIMAILVYVCGHVFTKRVGKGNCMQQISIASPASGKAGTHTDGSLLYWQPGRMTWTSMGPLGPIKQKKGKGSWSA